MIAGEAGRGRDFLLRREFLQAMERARSKLAVLVAAESKATLRLYWKQYFETEERLRRCLREIRRHPNNLSERRVAWLKALDLLMQPLPAADPKHPGEAYRLCRRLCDVLRILEGRAGGKCAHQPEGPIIEQKPDGLG